MVFGVAGRLKYMSGSVAVPEAGGLRYIVQVLDDTGEYLNNEHTDAVKKRWPAVASSYRQLYLTKFGKLNNGDIQSITVQSDTIVVNMIAANKKSIDVSAFKECLKKLAKDVAHDGGSVHIAKSGKNWKSIEKAINEELVKTGINVTVYQ